jgi:AraC-like DNA-binding protein/quercetin dioxygenase-like cupin family protein
MPPPVDNLVSAPYVSRLIACVLPMIVAKPTFARGAESKSTERDDYQDTPRPLAGMAKDFLDGSRIEPHCHPRAQLTWAVRGVMTVTAARGTWVVPPNRALWIPAETEHAIRMSGAVAMRAVYIDAAVAKTVAAECKVILVSPLLRALMLELVAAPLDYDESGRFGHVAALFLDEIRLLDAQPLHIPMPRDKRLLRVCEALLRDPRRRETLEAWSAQAGASSRTLARLFERETGMRFVAWRHQVRLAEALVRLAQGRDIAAAARAAGYDSTSAFSAMFRQALGKPPREYFGE